MYDPFANTRPHLKAGIVRRIEAGESIKAIVALPHMPSWNAVFKWRRADPDFRVAMDQARQRRANRALVFSDQVAESILALRREGAPIREILRAPGMPTRALFRYWRGTQGEFSAELARAKAEGDAEHGRRLRARAFRAYDAQLADRILAGVAEGHKLRELLQAHPTCPPARRSTVGAARSRSSPTTCASAPRSAPPAAGALADA